MWFFFKCVSFSKHIVFVVSAVAQSLIYPFEIILPIEGSLNYIDYYSILSYEDINPVSKFYFSGTLEPLKLAAKFNYYDKILSIRANWSNTVDLEFKWGYNLWVKR